MKMSRNKENNTGLWGMGIKKAKPSGLALKVIIKYIFN